MYNDDTSSDEIDMDLFTALWGDKNDSDGFVDTTSAQEIAEAGARLQVRKVEELARAEKDGILNRAELEPVLQAIVARTQRDNHTQIESEFIRVVEQASGYQWSNIQLWKGAWGQEGRYALPTWITDLFFSIRTIEPSPISISAQYEVGSTVEHDGQVYLVTSSSYSDIPATDDEGVEIGGPGWSSRLWPMDKIISVIAEQFRDGNATFTGPDTVLLSDEEHAVSLFNLAYSSELGLYERPHPGAPTGNQNAKKKGIKE